MTLNPGLLLLADSRLPAGASVHSGGVEAAVATGDVTDLDSLETFLIGRLETVGRVAAAFAARAALVTTDAAPPPGISALTELEGALDARTPSPAQRAASRAQGRALVRVARQAWPSPWWSQRWWAGLERGKATGPHQVIGLGVACSAAAGGPHDAAMLAASASVAGPASAALRLLGLDPLAVTAQLAGLSRRIDAVALAAAGCGMEELPAFGAPVLDLYAERHAAGSTALFAS
jgi:urease accessory protein